MSASPKMLYSLSWKRNATTSLSPEVEAAFPLDMFEFTSVECCGLRWCTYDVAVFSDELGLLLMLRYMVEFVTWV